MTQGLFGKGKAGRIVALGLACGLALAGLSGCEGSKAIYPDRGPTNKGQRIMVDPSNPPQRDSVLGPGGLDIFGNNSKGDDGSGSGGGIGVNSFLWRASLDTVGFMPLASADPFGGVILTDWYSTQDSPNERFKANIYIMSKSLRADGVKVSVFRQVKDAKGNWADAEVTKNVGASMEDAILTRARQLRLAVLQ